MTFPNDSLTPQPPAVQRPTVGSLFSYSWEMFKRSAPAILVWQIIMGVVLGIAMAIIGVAIGAIFGTSAQGAGALSTAALIGIIIASVIGVALVQPILYNLIIKGLQGKVEIDEAVKLPPGTYMMSVLWLCVYSLVSGAPSLIFNPAFRMDTSDPYAQMDLNPVWIFGSGGSTLLWIFVGPFFTFVIYGLLAGHFSSVVEAISWNLTSPTLRSNYLWVVGMLLLVGFLSGVGLMLCFVGALVTVPMGMFILAMIYGFLAQGDNQLAQQQVPRNT